MLTTQERQAIHLKVVESYFPEIAAGKDHPPLVSPAPTRLRPRSQSLSWSQIQAYLGTLGPLPHHCVSLGTCRDGLPLLIDLTDPGLGSILVQNDHAIVPEPLVEYMHLCHLQQPELAEVELVAVSAGSAAGRYPGSPDVYPADSDNAYACIYRLAEEIEARRNGRVWRRSPITLLVEDLSVYTSHLDDETVNYLAWIISAGGPVHIRVMAAATGRLSETLRRRLVPGFQHLIMPSNDPTRERGSYHTRLGGETLQFNLPV